MLLTGKDSSLSLIDTNKKIIHSTFSCLSFVISYFRLQPLTDPSCLCLRLSVGCPVPFKSDCYRISRYRRLSEGN